MELRISPCGKERSWQLWPHTEAIPHGIVTESATHILDLVGLANPDNADLRIDGMQLKALRNPFPGTARWEWQVGFHAGTVEIEITDGTGKTVRSEIVIDPDHRKLNRLAFETMIFETFEDMHAVCAMSPVRIGVDRGTKRPGLAKIELFRSRFNDLLRAIRKIEESPHRHLEAVEKIIPIQRANRITPTDLQRSLRYQPLIKVDNSYLPEAIRNSIPSRIAIHQRRASTDNPENRAVKACLVRWKNWLEQAARSFEVGAFKNDDRDEAGMSHIWARRCRTMSRQIHILLRSAFFAEVGEGDERIADGSSVFRSVPGYQQFSRIRRDLNYGLAAIAGDWLDMPVAQTWRLYELWAFWKLARGATLVSGTRTVSIKGMNKDRDGTIQLGSSSSDSLTIETGHFLQVHFQRRFTEYWTDTTGTGSFSREMIPDIAITVGSPKASGLIVLDAKYRVDNNLGDALTSIHTYRDALVQESVEGTPEVIVRGAYLVTPHVPGILKDEWKSETMPNLLFHPAYRAMFRFGAATMVPGQTSAEDAKEIIQKIIEDSHMAPSDEKTNY